MKSQEMNTHLRRMAEASAVAALPDVLFEHTVSCVDGRKTEGVVGTPGGNAGVFILMLAALEEFSGTNLDASEVDGIFARYLGMFGPFYMHTDELSLEHAATRFLANGDSAPTAGGSGPNARPDWMQNPPEEMRDKLLKVLIEPESNGCGHLRLMLEHPDEYRVRSEIVRAVLTAFYRRLWQGDDRLVLDVLEGVHEEQAVIRLHAGRQDGNGAATVLAPPSSDGTDVFLYHPEAAVYLQVENAAFLADIGLIDADQIEPFADLQHEMGYRQLHATLGHLAADLPICDATFEI